MNKGRRGQAPIRTRRRQSDAKWRASVASCYETLKFVIPNKDALPKRKTSKVRTFVEENSNSHVTMKTYIRCVYVYFLESFYLIGLLWAIRSLAKAFSLSITTISNKHRRKVYYFVFCPQYYLVSRKNSFYFLVHFNKMLIVMSSG